MSETHTRGSGATDARWQPISSAPKDGSRVLIFAKWKDGQQIAVARWDGDYRENGGWHEGYGTTYLPEVVIGWMPLPAPPGAGEPDAAPRRDENLSTEEMVIHPFMPHNGDWVKDIWCKDCAYHRDHQIHVAAQAIPAPPRGDTQKKAKD